MNWVNFFLTVATVAGIYSILTLSLNLQFGHGGLINFGVVAYFAAGAYGYVILTQPEPGLLDTYKIGLGLPMWVGFLGAGAAAGLFALVTGWPCLRLRGEYLALTTFAFAEVFHSFLLNEGRVSNGTLGFSGIARPFRDLLTGNGYRWLFLGMMLALLALVFAAAQRLVTSPYGRTLRAIRDDEIAAQLAEKRVQRFRLSIFLFGAVVTGFAGALFGWYTTLVNPGLFTAEVTFTAFIALVLGGVGSNVGAVVGAFVLVGFEELLRQFNFSSDVAARVSALRIALTGVLLIVLLRWRPGGGRAVLARLRRRRRPSGQDADLVADEAA